MNKLFRNIGILATVLTLAITIHVSIKPDLNTKITYAQLQKIKPVVIIDHATLLDPQLARQSVQPLTSLITGLGPFAALLKGQTFNVLIESNGGDVSLGYKIIHHLNMLKVNYGIKLKCYIKTAASMAFTLYLSICDEKIGLKGLKLMQHPVRYSNGVRTVKSLALDLEINATEARILKIKPSVWLKISKESGDHFFTKEEIKKYKLIDYYDK